MEELEAPASGARRVTMQLAERVPTLPYEDLPDPVVEEVGRVFTDFLGERLFVGATTQPWGQTISLKE